MDVIRSIHMTREEEAQFLKAVPHDYFEQDQLHVLLLNRHEDMKEIKDQLAAFLPFVSTWALTDSLTLPKVKDHTLLAAAANCLQSPHSYTRRLGILWIMKRGIKRQDAAFWLDAALQTPGIEKEIILAKGWLLCEYMIHCPHIARERLQDDSLEKLVLCQAIRKCLDSRRISSQDKQVLKQLRTR